MNNVRCFNCFVFVKLTQNLRDFRAEFLHITRDTMERLNDANIANLLGSVDASADGGTHQHRNATLHWFVFEHLPLGDLKQFLRRHRPAPTTADTAELVENTLR